MTNEPKPARKPRPRLTPGEIRARAEERARALEQKQEERIRELAQEIDDAAGGLPGTRCEEVRQWVAMLPK